MAISNKVCGYLNTINQICGNFWPNFYRCDTLYTHGYPSKISMITLLIRMMILLLYFCLICSFKHKNSYFLMLYILITKIYDYKIICNVVCENVNYKISVINQMDHLTIMNVSFILCWMDGIELNGILNKTKGKIMQDVAGKEGMLYKLKVVEFVATVVTIGFNVKTVEYRNILFVVCHVDGRDKIGSLLRRYYQSIHGIVFVVNSNNCKRIDGPCAKQEVIQQYLSVFVNKQDLPNKMSTNQVTKRSDWNQFAAFSIK